MKPIPLIFLAAMAGSAFVFSQDETSPITAHVLGNIPDGTPPPIEPPKPAFIVPAEDVLQTETHHQGGRKIIVREITPVELPAPSVVEPPPADLAPPHPASHSTENFTGFEFICVGASVFHPKDLAARTLVDFSPLGHAATPVTFWSSADFGLFTGFASYVGSDGIERNLMMGWGSREIEHVSELTTESGALALGVPKMPELPAGKATFSIISGQPTAETLTAIQSLHDVYNNEYERLKTAYEGRERARIAHEAELKAHPPKPKDIVINYWHIDDPRPTAPATSTEGANP